MLSTPYISADYEFVYEPSEDSFLFLDTFEEHPPVPVSKTPVVVEIGTGSGIITTFLKMHNLIPGAFHIMTDVNEMALQAAKNTLERNCTGNVSPAYADTLRCSLTDSFRSESIDMLFFNPPYVPSESVPQLPTSSCSGEYDSSRGDWLDLALVGGDDGMEVTQLLLDDLPRVLASKGEAYVLFCKRNKHEEVTARFRNKWGWRVELIVEKKCAWEVLCIYRFSKP
ncbi:S-adenosylmethionine-dependent methyltransferase [Martiniozyma asiatica (nom. inval.)]|nr:S-adenosylmethionine-dependent methyltransferase [Martiniozyma asiatica]